MRASTRKKTPVKNLIFLNFRLFGRQIEPTGPAPIEEFALMYPAHPPQTTQCMGDGRECTQMKEWLKLEHAFLFYAQNTFYSSLRNKSVD